LVGQTVCDDDQSQTAFNPSSSFMPSTYCTTYLRMVRCGAVQIIALLSVHAVDEVPDLSSDLISVPETRRILMLRRDLGELSIQRIVEWMGQQAAEAEAAEAAAANAAAAAAAATSSS
jgi:hypothetical protein